jgi:hypothetical protein
MPPPEARVAPPPSPIPPMPGVELIRPPAQLQNPDRRRFTEVDDDRLAEIVSRYNTERLRSADWRQIQRELAAPFTVDQIKHRWFNFLKPPFNRAAFTKDDKKEALRLYMDAPNNWKKIAARFGDGQSRSAEMMENLLKTINRKLKRFGLTLEHRDDVELLPDEFFNRGFPNVTERIALLREFELAKGMMWGMNRIPSQVPLPAFPGLLVPRSV